MSAQPSASDLPRVVVFDLGGVLVDWNPRYLLARLIPDPEALERALAEAINQPFLLSLDIARDSGHPMRAAMIRRPGHAALYEAYVTRFQETIQGGIEPMVGAARRLHDAGVPLHGLTNWAADTFAATRARLPFLSLFRDIVVSGEEGVIKPDPAIFDILFRRGGFTAADAVFVDDSEKNCIGARAVGLRAIHHRTPDETIAALRALGLPA